MPERDYLGALLADLAGELALAGDREIDTVFFGGGTPSLFSPGSLRAIVERAPGQPKEITLEANPGAVERGSFAAYRRAGVTRVSLGAQSFDPAQLARLGRIHGPEEVRAAASEAAAAGLASFNIDLMYGLPEQTTTDALADLEEAMRLAPPHVSWYQLTIEPKTEFHQRPPAGLPSPDEAAAMERAGLDLLARHGYERYEVSAFARPGHRCAHNLNYWRFGDYLGVGAGAHGKITVGGAVRRTTKPPQPRRYLAGVAGAGSAVAAAQLPSEFMMNALRLVDGVPRALFAERTGLPFKAVARTVNELVDWGLMRRDRLALTERGFRQLDGVVARFLPP